jgi:hypothetical protein
MIPRLAWKEIPGAAAGVDRNLRTGDRFDWRFGNLTAIIWAARQAVTIPAAAPGSGQRPTTFAGETLMDPIIAAFGLTKEFSGKVVVDRLELALPPGAVWHV